MEINGLNISITISRLPELGSLALAQNLDSLPIEIGQVLSGDVVFYTALSPKGFAGDSFEYT
eukprot:scaffold42566_cov50-Prasinocladus_malaysianus.AAC.1